MAFPARMNDAKAKYDRAQVHLAALQVALSNFDESDPWQPEQSNDLPEGMVRIRINRYPPAEISVILGDAVHNLRSSLDYATCSLVEASDPTFDLKRTQFPFGRPDKILNSGERSSLGSIHPHALHAIEEARGCGGPYLHLLNALSNQDKHRLLVKPTVRQYPIRVEVNHDRKTAGFVSDLEGQPDVWFRSLEDEDIIPMPPVLSLKVGLVLTGAAHPYAIPAINQVNSVVGHALNIMSLAVVIP